MTLVPGWMWQTMHWLVGMRCPWRTCGRSDGPARPCGMVGSGREAQAAWPYFGIGAGVDRRAVVGVDDVAGGAAAGAVVAGMVVGAQEIERRVEQARLLQAEERRDRCGSRCRGRGSLRRLRIGRPGSSSAFGDADLGPELAAALEDAQDVARLRDLEARQRIEERHDALLADLLLGRRRHGLQPLRHAVHAVAFAEARPLVGDGAVVVEGGAPEHAAVRHHALADLSAPRAVAAGGAAADVGDAQVAGVDEADELGRLVVQQRVGAHRVGRRSARPRGSAGWTWAVCTCPSPSASPPWQSTQPRCKRLLVVGIVDVLVAGDAADALGGGLLLGLLEQVDAVGGGRPGPVRGDRVADGT